MEEVRWYESERRRALVFGLPSVLFAVVGVGMLCWAKYGLSSSLETVYRKRAEQSATEKTRVSQELVRELKTLNSAEKTGVANGEGPARNLIPKDDKRVVEFVKWQNQEEAYWKKLRELNPDEPEYLYQLALISWSKKEVNLGIAQMNRIAPLGEPGYVKAHLWLANQSLGAARNNARTIAERQRFLQLADRHSDQCLKTDRDNLDAKLIKAQVYSAVGKFAESYQYFSDLNKTNVRYFRNLIRINYLLKRESANEEILRDAIVRYGTLMRSDTIQEIDRVRGWIDVTFAYRELQEFETIESLLVEELKRYDASGGESTGRIQMKRLLAEVYMDWSVSLDDGDPTVSQRRLELAEKAYRNDASNPYVMRALTRLGVDSDEEIAARAKLVYDPAGKTDVPAMVYNQLGIQALGRAFYADAIRNFEKARLVNPRDSEVLNNLAYSYLCCDPPDPKRALKLIDEALRFRNRNQMKREYLTSFHDTRGRALMQLNQTAEAIAEFEIALKNRDETDIPGMRAIIEAIIECYGVLGLGSEPYQKRLKRLNERESLAPDKPPSQSQPATPPAVDASSK